MAKKTEKKGSDKERAQEQERAKVDEKDSATLDYVDPFDHYVAQARGLDPMGLIGR